jgi:hypothetical protein
MLLALCLRGRRRRRSNPISASEQAQKAGE